MKGIVIGCFEIWSRSGETHAVSREERRVLRRPPPCPALRARPCTHGAGHISTHDPAGSIRAERLRQLDVRAQPNNLRLPAPADRSSRSIFSLRFFPARQPRHGDRSNRTRPLPSARPNLDANEYSSFRRHRPCSRSRIPRSAIFAIVRSRSRPVRRRFQRVKGVREDIVIVFREGEAAERAGPTFACFASCPVSGDNEQAQVDRGFAAVCC